MARQRSPSIEHNPGAAVATPLMHTVDYVQGSSPSIPTLNVSYESLPGADSVDPMQTVREADPGDIRRLIAWVWKRTSVAVS